MTRYMMYKHKINNMGNKRLPKIALNSSQNQLHLKRCWCKDTMAWLNHWGIDENDICKTMIMSKMLLLRSLKINCGVRKNLVVKGKLRYYKEDINPNLED